MHTVDVAQGGRSYAVDTGFVVYNESTYPEFTRLLDRLGVATQPTEMSFSVHCESTGLEYCGSSLSGLFAQRRNLLRPAFLRMLRDILRFNRLAHRVLLEGPLDATLGDLLRSQRLSPEFRRYYLLPMAAAIWSAAPAATLDFPAEFFLRFFHNHGLLGLRTQLPWRVIRGGSARYVEALTRPFRDRLRLGQPVAEVRRRQEYVEIAVAGEPPQRFDRVILAVHADQALALLSDADALERELLGAFAYQTNRAVLHTDGDLLPRRRAARASWNYHVEASAAAAPGVTYDMSRLQRLPTADPFCVTLNQDARVRHDRVLSRLDFAHPVYSSRALDAQRRHAEIDGLRRTHFCGAYWGQGFHEDGLRSAQTVCRRLAAGA